MANSWRERRSSVPSCALNALSPQQTILTIGCAISSMVQEDSFSASMSLRGSFNLTELPQWWALYVGTSLVLSSNAAEVTAITSRD